MAVIINELEVVLETQSSAPPAQATAPKAQSTQQIQPMDVLDIVEREARVEWRLLAH